MNDMFNTGDQMANHPAFQSDEQPQPHRLTRNQSELVLKSVPPNGDPTLGLKLLFVDDEPSILATLPLILKSKGFDVHTADSGKAAKAALVQTSFDVVVTDLSMESATAGYEVVHAALAQTEKPVTMVVSGYPELLHKWQTEGADAGLQKPTEVSELLEAIDGLVKNRQQNLAEKDKPIFRHP
jgi:DNA-binding response OmpR family regulator